MNSLMQLIIALVLLMAQPWAQAHESHDHGPVTMKKAVEIALATVRDFSINAQPSLGLPQLDQSWGNLPENAVRIYENGRGYYLVSIENPAQMKKLYLRIMLDGRVDAANFSGDFASSMATSSTGA